MIWVWAGALILGLAGGWWLRGLIGTRRDVAGLAAAQERVRNLEDRVAALTKESDAVRTETQRERDQRIALETRLAERERALTEERKVLDDAKHELTNTFKALSGEVLQQQTDAFLKNAGHALHENVRPLTEKLGEYQLGVKALESARSAAHGELKSQVEALLKAEQTLSRQTDRLTMALRVPQVRGRWGELTLQRVVELAGLSEHCDFTEQASIETEEGRQRPDVIVHLPGGQHVVVDAKTPLDAYMSALERPEDEQEPALREHAKHLRSHMLRLASKAYWSQFQKAPEFVVMFVPGESFFGAALRHDRTLLEEGVANRVVLATPVTLIALLRAIAYGWRQEQFTKSAQIVADLGKELYRRMATYLEHVDRMRRGLKQSVEAFNDMTGSLETRVLPSLRKFPELGVTGEDELQRTEPIEMLPRETTAKEHASTEAD